MNKTNIFRMFKTDLGSYKSFYVNSPFIISEGIIQGYLYALLIKDDIPNIVITTNCYPNWMPYSLMKNYYTERQERLTKACKKKFKGKPLLYLFVINGNYILNK